MTYFQDKTVLITGAASGIGCALAKSLCEAGAKVYAGDINQDGLNTLVDKAKGTHCVVAVQLNVSLEGDFSRAIKQIVDEHGHLDIIVNNAGIVLRGDFNDTSMEQLRKITDINFWGVVYGTKLAYTQMRKQGFGQIVNVSSSAGIMPVPNSTMYSALKHAVIGLSHSLREEAALHGIQVNVILPGMVQSNIWNEAINVEDYDYKKNMENTGLKPISADAAARAIMQGMDTNQRSIIFPFINRLVIRLYRWFPSLINKVAVAPLAKNNI